MLPVAIVLGISSYLVYHFVPALRPIGPACHAFAAEGQRWVIALLLFFQFVKVSPHDIKFCRWHLRALLIQVCSFLVLALVTAFTGPGAARIVLESAMLCLICPTASAAGVVTEKLGGRLNETVSYVVMINCVATLLIPLVIPLVRPSADMGFWAYVGHIALRVFPVLLLPCALAWIIRYTTHKLQRILMRWSKYSFYIWGVGLTLAMVLSTRALVLSGLGLGPVACIVAVSIACCFVQFFLGREISPRASLGRDDKGGALGRDDKGGALSRDDKVGALGRDDSEAGRVTSGQALGQKNTGFLIWLGYSYMTPVTSVAGGLYAIWQNLFNSWELYKKGK